MLRSLAIASYLSGKDESSTVLAFCGDILELE